MAADELTRPLGLKPARSRYRTMRIVAIAAPPAVLGIAAAVYLLLPPSQPAPTGKAVAGAAADRTGSVPAHPLPPMASEGPGLVELTPDAGGLAPVGGEVVITDPNSPPAVRLAAAPREDLVEKTRDGLLPRIGDDGTRPMEAYARPADPEPGAKRIVIVIGGLGLDAEGSAMAIRRLPGAVTLGLAPYGTDLPRVLAEARNDGHEVLLQIPMEPYDYPDINPGPKTLTVNASAAENMNRLRWLMSRLTTYVGVMNYMGARLTGDETALKPILAEVASRGLLFLDDGSSSGSRATEIPGVGEVLRADVVLDADTTPAAIDAKLKQLAAIARQRGYAIATGSAFPSTVDRISAFAAKAEQQGFVLVPLSSIVQSGRT